MRRANSWARHSYPVQSPPCEKLAERDGGALTLSQSQRTAQLPKYLRAAKNAHHFKPEGRTIIICLDGTGDQFDGDNSNIVHLVSCLKKDDPSQLTYYQSGIGTYDGGGLSNGMSAVVDMAVGSGLGVHIRDAYHFLMQNYHEGDKVCLFGFSRGAYTARCLAGMLHKVGLLPAHNTAQIPFAYKFYKDDSRNGWDMSSDFKKTFCIDLNVYFIGVFDSVASVGFIPRKLPLSSTPTNKPTYFRHAMALDERRAKFKPCRYRKLDDIGSMAEWTTIAETRDSQRIDSGLGHPHNGVSSASSETTKDEKDEKEQHTQTGVHVRETDVIEVWFTGCHADVGGGAVKNEVRHKLSNIPLRWMIRQSFECDTGILFNIHRLAEQGLDVHTLWPTYSRLPKPLVGPPPSMIKKYQDGHLGSISLRSNALTAATEDTSGDGTYYNVNVWAGDSTQTPVAQWVPEQHEDHFDAMADINDQLAQAKGWWILEVWPIKVRVQPKDSDGWVKKLRLNLGRFRPVQETDPNLHWTVRQRMQEKEYRIGARVDKNATWKIVV